MNKTLEKKTFKKNSLKLIMLILTLLVALTGCADKGEEDLYFDIDREAAVNYVKTVVSTYNGVSDTEADYYLNDGLEIEKTAVAGFRAAQTTDHVGAFVGFDTSEKNVKFSNGVHGKVLCTITCLFENREVEVTVSFLPDRAYSVLYENNLQQIEEVAAKNGMEPLAFIQAYFNNGQYDVTSVEAFLNGYIYDQYQKYPFIPQDCEVSAVYSKSELLKAAGANTMIGMITVFTVLIFIAFIIYLLRFVPKLLIKEVAPSKNSQNKDKDPISEKKVVVTPLEKSASKAAAKEENLMNDSELVAVITAAIYAMESSSGKGSRGPVTTASNDRLVVRSIRRAR